MREGSVRCLDPHGFHIMRYVEWGDAKNPRVLVCVHGLTRNARDFAPKAEGQAGRNKTFYKWSVVAVGAANAADTFSSWGQSESNPALGGTFGGKSMALKAAFIGTSFVIERVALRHNPKLYKSLGWLNMAVAGGLGAAAAHNVQIR